MTNSIYDTNIKIKDHDMMIAMIDADVKIDDNLYYFWFNDEQYINGRDSIRNNLIIDYSILANSPEYQKYRDHLNILKVLVIYKIDKNGIKSDDLFLIGVRSSFKMIKSKMQEYANIQNIVLKKTICPSLDDLKDFPISLIQNNQLSICTFKNNNENNPMSPLTVSSTCNSGSIISTNTSDIQNITIDFHKNINILNKLLSQKEENYPIAKGFINELKSDDKKYIPIIWDLLNMVSNNYHVSNIKK